MADDDLELPEPREADEQPGVRDVLTSDKTSVEAPYRAGEAEIVEWVEALYTSASQGKDDMCEPDTWSDDLEAYWGGSTPAGLASFKPRVSVNELKSLILQDLSDLTDSRVTIIVQKDKRTTQRDDVVEQTIQTQWKRKFWDLVVLQAALDAYIYPLGFFQTSIDPYAEDGQGEVLFGARDPRTVFPDPTAEDDQKLRFYILEDILDLLEIRRNFPETGIHVQPESSYSEKVPQANERPAPRAGSGYTGPLYTKTGMSGVPGWAKAQARQLTCVVEDEDQVEEVNQVAGQLRQRKVKRYPHRRLIMLANKRVLYDDDCPLHYAPMITKVQLQPSVHAYWPQQSLVNEFAGLAANANKADSLVLENMLRLNAGQRFGDADCGINPKTWAAIPGLMTLLKPGSKVWDLPTLAMGPEMVGEGEKLRGMMRSVMGFPLSRTGAGTHGNVAAELAETEISQSMGLTRLRSRLLYQSVQKAVEMIFARMAQAYTVPRHFPYIENGDLKSIKWEPIANPEQYVAHVDPDSFTVKSKTMLQRIALALAKMGKLPNARLLKILEVPDADAIAAELKEELTLMALAKMKQKGGRGK